MPKYQLAHANDEEEQDFPEIVGSKDLRESFKDNGLIRGSFFVNGYEFHQFESNSIDNLLAQLNARQSNTHVRASIDDGYHLVLEANSPAPIQIRAGAPYVAPPPVAGSGDAADQVLQKLKVAADKDANKGEDGKPKNSVLELLGLEATEDTPAVAGATATPPGMSAEDRRKAREEAQKSGQAPGQMMFSTAPGTGASPSAGTAGMTDTVPTEQSAPITGSPEGGKMADGRDRTGQGTGYSTKPDGTPPVVGTPARTAQQGGPGGINDPTANVPHRPNPQSL